MVTAILPTTSTSSTCRWAPALVRPRMRARRPTITRLRLVSSLSPPPATPATRLTLPAAPAFNACHQRCEHRRYRHPVCSPDSQLASRYRRKQIGAPGGFNPQITSPTDITGDVKLANDGRRIFSGFSPGTVGTTTDGCQPFPAGFFTGQLALIDRGGGCGFTFKAKNAQDAGADRRDRREQRDRHDLNGGIDASITIMSLSITLADGNAIKAHLAAGSTLRLNSTAPATP